MRRWILLFVALAILLPPVPALFDEAKGIVTYVTDGDTITVEGVGVVRLADVDSSELAATGGPEAKEYTRNQLLGKTVFLDQDNKTGLDRYGRMVCVVFLANADGTVKEIFNRMLVDAGHATVDDVKDNEFDPREWWETTGLNTDPIADKKFVGSTESDKYHYPECRWAKKISPDNEIWFSSSEDAKSKGYVPCKVCHPT
ncbi:MAG: thermonuclease family protein [Methanothrix sp.]|jgi:micrococcal nuclease|nr:thermonuclease family protein [Methanothrix sp.]